VAAADRRLTEGYGVKRFGHDYAKARKLRREMSLPEGLLWRELRAGEGGIKLRRQHPYGRYVIDFYCAAARLGIEIDGLAHDMGDNPERDAKRDAWLRDHGIEIVRIPASVVLENPKNAAEAIVALCRERS
jgi:very-short-patch-repair endonuclease